MRRLVRLYELDGVFGIAALATRKKIGELELTRAYTKIGEALSLDWAQQQVARFVPADQWERLLTAGLSRDFEQLRIDFLARGRNGDPVGWVEDWIERQSPRIEQFRQLVARARRRGQCQRADARANRQPGADLARAMIARRGAGPGTRLCGTLELGL